GDRLEATRNAADSLQTAGDRVVLDAEQAARGQRAERILRVEAAAQLDVDSVQLIRADLGRVGEPEGQRIRPIRGELAAPVVADVDRRGRTAVDEQPSLRLEVALHRLVEVEVVLAQVREDERREPHPVEAAELRSVRGRLHRAAAVAGVEHLAESALDVDRLGGRTDRGAALASHAALDRAEQAGAAAGGGEDRVEQERGRRLPVRAGDARDL